MKLYKPRGLVLVGILLMTSFFTRQVTLARNYEDPHGPQYVGNFAEDQPALVDSIVVVSYNIKHARNIDKAMEELADIEPLAQADILLLQEMDEMAVEELAKSHGYNYVYFPAALHPKYKKNFGNAILSKWPIRDGEKLIFPGQSLARRMTRQATKAIVSIGDTDILVYSLHAEAIMSLPSYRWDQYLTLISDIQADAEYVIVGGDFNTITTDEVGELAEAFANVGLVRASTGTGYTLSNYMVEVIADHIFTKGFAVTEVGKVEDATASDHLPIWVELVLD